MRWLVLVVVLLGCGPESETCYSSETRPDRTFCKVCLSYAGSEYCVSNAMGGCHFAKCGPGPDYRTVVVGCDIVCGTPGWEAKLVQLGRETCQTMWGPIDCEVPHD